MSLNHVQISIEELAFALGVLGGTDVASGFLLSVLGERSQQEIEGRLLSAAHSLMARGHLEVIGEEKRLDAGLGALVLPLLENRFSLRCSRSAKGVEDLLTIFATEKTIVEERSVQEVVCRLEALESWRVALDHSRAFFGLPADPTGNGQDRGPVGTLPVDRLDQIKAMVPGASREEIVARLQSASLANGVLEQLADDFLSQEYRGSVIRVENRDGQMVSDEGFLVLKGPRRFWLFPVVPGDQPLVAVLPGTGRAYGDLFHTLARQR